MITFTKISFSDGLWRFEWASGLGTIRIVLWGRLLEETDENEYIYDNELYATETYPPPIEVVLQNEKALSEKNLPYLILQWHRVNCERYIIQRYKDSEWENFAEIRDDELVEVVSYTTPVQEDQTESEWRIKAVNEEEREGEPLNYKWKIVRPPDPPEDVAISYEEGTLTIAEGE